MGVDPSLVFKTIVTLVDDKFTVGLVPVECMLDLKALAEQVAKQTTVSSAR